MICSRVLEGSAVAPVSMMPAAPSGWNVQGAATARNEQPNSAPMTVVTDAVAKRAAKSCDHFVARPPSSSSDAIVDEAIAALPVREPARTW